MSTFYQTNKSSANTFIRRVGEGVIQWSRGVKPTSPGVYPQLYNGQLVSLDATTGEVIPTPNATTASVGVVMVANSTLNDQRVPIMSQGTSVIRTSAAAALNYGVLVSTWDFNTTTNLPKATAAATGQWATGITLTNAALAADELEVLVFASPILLP